MHTLVEVHSLSLDERFDRGNSDKQGHAHRQIYESDRRWEEGRERSEMHTQQSGLGYELQKQVQEECDGVWVPTSDIYSAQT
eukprot:1146999-Pelagomonas_calceolata.AAC.4